MRKIQPGKEITVASGAVNKSICTLFMLFSKNKVIGVKMKE